MFKSLCITLLSGILYLCSTAWAYDLHDNAILHAQRGKLFLDRQQYDLAVDEYQAAIRLNPQTSMSGSLYNNLGIAHRENKQYTLAIASFQHACRIQPTYAIYFQNLINTYIAAGQQAEAGQTLKEITVTNPDDAEAWFMRGLLYKETGDLKAAKACFARFLKLRPESELARAARTAL